MRPVPRRRLREDDERCFQTPKQAYNAVMAGTVIQLKNRTSQDMIERSVVIVLLSGCRVLMVSTVVISGPLMAEKETIFGVRRRQSLL